SSSTVKDVARSQDHTGGDFVSPRDFILASCKDEDTAPKINFASLLSRQGWTDMLNSLIPSAPPRNSDSVGPATEDLFATPNPMSRSRNSRPSTARRLSKTTSTRGGQSSSSFPARRDCKKAPSSTSRHSASAAPPRRKSLVSPVLPMPPRTTDSTQAASQERGNPRSTETL
ncbi:unnamed protein product, partial [Amoebophrya sp. A25]